MRIHNKRNGLREAGSEYDKQITFMLRSKRKKEKKKVRELCISIKATCAIIETEGTPV